MNIIRNLVAGVLLAVMPLAMTASASAQTFNDGGNGCSVTELGIRNGGSFTVNGNQATTKVEVKGPAGCKETVSLASWNTALGSNSFRPLENQRFVDGLTYSNLGVGKHSLSIFVNTVCNFQADIVLGSHPKSLAHNDANYGPELMGYTQIHTGVCQKPTKPVVPPKPVVNICSGNTTNVNTGTAAQGGDCSTNNVSNTTVVEETASTPTAQVTQPTELVNTGPGNVAALFGIATVGGYFIRRTLLRKALQS